MLNEIMYVKHIVGMLSKGGCFIPLQAGLAEDVNYSYT